MKLFNRENFRWLGQVELGASVSDVNVLDFIDLGNKFQRGKIEPMVQRLSKAPEPEEETEDEDNFSFGGTMYFEGNRNTKDSTSALAESISLAQKDIDKEFKNLDRDQKKLLTFLLVKAKEGNVKFYERQNTAVRMTMDVHKLIDFVKNQPDADQLNLVAEFLKKGVFYLNYSSPIARGSNGVTAEVALGFYDDLKRIYGAKISGKVFAKIEEFLISTGTRENVADYIKNVTRIKNELKKNHLRIEKGLFDVLTHHSEHGKYREQIKDLDSEKIEYVSKVLKKFIHPSKFRTEVGFREFLEIINFIYRNKKHFDEVITWENDWWDLDDNLHHLFKSPNEKLQEIDKKDLFDRYKDPKKETVDLVGEEMRRQFPSIDGVAEFFSLSPDEVKSSVGSMFLDIFMKFSQIRYQEYFLNRDYRMFDEPTDLFTRFAVVGNLCNEIVKDKYKLQFIKDNFDIKSISDVVFIANLLNTKDNFYIERIKMLKGILQEKINVNDSLHYYLLYHKVESHWKETNEDLENLKSVTEVMGKKVAIPFYGQELVSNVGRTGETVRAIHYPLAWYFEIKSSDTDRDGDEQRKYLGEMESFYRHIDDWKNEKELLIKAKNDGVFSEPNQKNILCPYQIKAFYSMDEESQDKFAKILGFPKYDFSSSDFNIMFNAVNGEISGVVKLLEGGRDMPSKYFESIKSLLPEGSKESIKEVIRDLFKKNRREREDRYLYEEKDHKYVIKAMTEQQLSLLKFVYGDDIDGLNSYLTTYLEYLADDDCYILKPNGMHGLMPVVSYMLEHRDESWVRLDLCSKLIGNDYYRTLECKDFIFEYKIRDKGINEENYLDVWNIMFDDSDRKLTRKNRKELAEIMDRPEFRRFLRKKVLNLVTNEDTGKKNSYLSKIKEELQFLLYLAPELRDKIIPDIDINRAKMSYRIFDNYYGNYKDFDGREPHTLRSDWLLQLEYLLEPEDRQPIYSNLNRRFVTAVTEELEAEEKGRVSINDQLKFISKSPYGTEWLDKEALKTADFIFDRYGSSERFTEYFNQAKPLQITEHNWVEMLNLFTYQNKKDLEGYSELEAFIKSEEVNLKLVEFSKKRLATYLDGNIELTTQEKILFNFLNSYRFREHGQLLVFVNAIAKQIEFLSKNLKNDEKYVKESLKRCLTIEDKETYYIAVSLILNTAVFIDMSSDPEKSLAVDLIFENLFEESLEDFITKLKSDESIPKQILFKKLEFLNVMNRMLPFITKIFDDELKLKDFLSFLEVTLGNSIENLKKFRFMNGMSEEYIKILKETLGHSPKNFISVLELLNIAKTVGLPITKGFADFITKIDSFSNEKLLKIFDTLQKAGIKTIRRDKFARLLERHEKAKSINDTKTVVALEKEIKLFFVPILVKFFENKITSNVITMINMDFELDKFEFDSVDWENFTSAYRMYKRLINDKPEDARIAKVMLAKSLKQEENIWKSFPENRKWIDKNLSAEYSEDFMGENKREFDVGNLSSNNLEDQLNHFIGESKRCLSKLAKLANLNLTISDTLSEFDLIQIFKQIKDRMWNDEEKLVYEDLKIQIDGLEQVITLKNSKGNLPKKITIERETNPIMITQMGTVVQGSCLNADSINYWSAFTNAVEVNKCLFWVRDENGNILARILCGIDNTKKIVRFPVYYTGHSGLNVNLFFNQYLRDFTEKYGFSLNGDSGNVTNLVMSRWYKDPEVEV